MGKTWQHHAAALLLLAAVGLMVMVGVVDRPPGTLGTRAFGYGALVLLGVALTIGPLARLWPHRLAVLLPYRRAMGVWSVLSALTHFLFALQLVAFYGISLKRLFFQSYFYTGATGRTHEQLVPNITNTQSVLAWAGMIALVVLLVIAAVSNDPVQRFLGVPAWKLIQQQSYTAIMFVMLHLLVMRYVGKLKMSPSLERWALWVPAVVFVLQVAGFSYTIWKQGVIRARAGRKAG